ncbi:sigma 54-interacting transcriptional regulator [Rapidithrix thailandica]|uniref:Sigma 54-interacting transcriptional regulator n=1 Tax=Rapidithrix thailandica TaxID=413964 RepID=A0AAW9S4F9_9BACT
MSDITDFDIDVCIIDLREMPCLVPDAIKKAFLTYGITCQSKDSLPEIPHYAICLLDGKINVEKLHDFLKVLLEKGCKRTVGILYNNVNVDPAYVWQLLKCGISDVCKWESNSTEKCLISKILKWEKIEKTLQSGYIKDRLIGQCANWIAVLKQLIEFSVFTNGSGIILGESGTGKEMAAHLIHHLDNRENKKNLVLLDCTTIVPELSGSEFFGHERGAFTNAIASRDGAFALADNGTLFLDEVGELPPTMQAGLLRVIQEGTYKRVGSNNWRKTQFRLICATNRNLNTEVQSRNFRQDLYYRIATWTFRLPPLRERVADIPILAYHFFQKYFKGISPPPVDKLVLDYLIAKDYPGNIRELQHLVTRIASRYSGEGPITVGDIPENDRQSFAFHQEHLNGEFEKAMQKALSYGMDLKDIKELSADIAIDIVLKQEKGIVKNAAKRLGVTDRAIQLRLAGRRQKLPS